MVELRSGQGDFALVPRWLLYPTDKSKLLTACGDPDQMPRLRDSFQNQVAFLYQTKDDAEVNERLGGSGFLIGRKTADGEGYIPYLVSNRHVVWEGECTHIRFKRRDGVPGVISIRQEDWFVHPERYDVAVTCLAGLLDRAVHVYGFVAEEDFLTQEAISQYDIGVGDDVFMIGRFLNHQGGEQIRPAVRFGSISMMLEAISAGHGFPPAKSFAVEMRSRTGFSGSPVHVYRTPYNILESEHNKQFHLLLGINFGYVNDERGDNTWLNGVVPAWHITETLNIPLLQKRQCDIEASVSASRARTNASFTLAL